MAPKKKTTVAVGQSEAGQPVPMRASSRSVAEKTRGAAREHQHHPSSQSLGGGDVCAPGNGPHIAKSKGGARPSMGGAGPSKVIAAPPEGDTRASRTPTPAPTARSSQAARDERRNHAEDPGHRRGKSPSATLETEKTCPLAEALVKTACDRGVVIELLLTWSEVEARHDPCRFRCH